MLKRIISAVIAVTMTFNMAMPTVYAMENAEYIQADAIHQEQVVDATDNLADTSEDVLSETEQTKAEEIVISQSEEFVQEYSAADFDLPANDEIFAAYVEQQFYGNSFAAFGINARERLNENEKKLYDFLKAEIENVAKNGGSTVFTVADLAEIGIKDTWTAAELGVEHIVSSAEVQQLFLAQFDLDKIHQALLTDCPYELYWYDKTSGISSTFRMTGSGYYDENGIFQYSYLKIFDYTVSFYVADNYFDNYNDFAVTSAVSRVDVAVNNAKNIADKYKNETTYNKLVAFKDEICSLVTYDHSAASDGSFAENNDPWQLINVFDGDAATNVVCEGYSKAFMYLCDLAEIECYTVSGLMSGATGAGGHMWNIVVLNGKNYLADVTNSDNGTIGSNGKLFLTGTTGSVEEGYVFYVNGTNVIYCYYTDTIELLGSEILQLAESEYDPVTHTEVIDEAVPPTCTETGLTEGRHCSVCGEIIIPQEIIPETGHNYIATVTKPTCTQTGYTTYKCDVCDDEYIADDTAALGHTEVIDEAVAPSCTNTGLTEGKHCSVCGEIIIPQKIVDALGHSFTNYVSDSDATCTEDGHETAKCDRCNITDSRIDEESALGHTEVIDEAVPPTIATTGLTEGKHCSVCSEVLVPQQVVPATGNVIDSGSCSSEVKWAFCDTDKNGTGDTLVISGTGEMPSFLYSNQPYSEYIWDIENIVIEEGITTVGNFAFYSSTAKSVTLPDGITSIGERAFERSYIRSIDIPDTVTFIGQGAFYDCIYLESIVVPEGITGIGSSTFEFCSSMKTITIPSTVTTMGSSSFSHCYSLEGVYITDLEAWCKIQFNEDSGDIDNPLEYAGNLYLNGSLVTKLQVPEGITKLDETFAGCESIETVVLPDSVEIIDDESFLNCKNLEIVLIPKSVEEIGYEAFFGCNSLDTVYYTGTEEEWSQISISSNNYPIFDANIIYNFSGHIPGEVATCTEPQTCRICGMIIEDALGHQFEYLKDDKQGTYTYKCNRCDKTITVKLPVTISCIIGSKTKIVPEFSQLDTSEELGFIWNIENEDIATYNSETSEITAVDLGETTATITETTTGITISTKVTVKLPATEQLSAKVYLDGVSENGLKFSETARIEISSETAGIIPNDKFTFTSDANVTVDENGVVTSAYAGAKPGKAGVTATLKTESKSVKVEIPLIVALAGIASKDVTAELGKTAVLPAVTKVPATAGEDISIEWAVAHGSEDIIELVEDNGKTVIGTKDIGIAQLVATDTNSGFSTTVNVTVKLPKTEKLTAAWDAEIDKAGLEAGESRTMVIAGSTVGAMAAKYFDFKSSNEKAVTVDENGVITVVFTGSGTASANATITATVKGDATKKTTLTVKAIPKQTAGIEITAEYDNAEITVATDGESGVQTLIIPRSLVKDGTLPISLKAVAKDAQGNEVITNVKWTSDAANIAKVVAVKGTTDSADVTVGKNVDGLAVITATANDLKKTTATIEIDVRDYTPRLESNTVTLNTYLEDGAQVRLYTAYDAILKDYPSQVAMLLAEETEVIGVNLSGTGSENFFAEYDSESGMVTFNSYDVMAKNNAQYKLTLNVNTAKGETSQAVTIKVANKLPVVTVKQATPFEMFYKDSTSDVTVTAKDAVITSVEMPETATFTASAYDAAKEGITISYRNPADPLSTFVNNKPDAKTTLAVSFEGYRTSFEVKNFTIKTKETKVTLGQSRAATKYTALGNDNTPINVINTKTKEVIDLTECTVTAQTASAGYVTVTKDGTELTVTPKLTDGKFNVNGKASTNHAAKVDVQHNNWLRAVTISHNISINTAAVTMRLKAANLKLNSAFDTVAQTVIVPSVDNCPEFLWTVTEQPTKTQKAEDFAKLDVKVNGWEVTAQFKDGVPSKGNYKYLLTTMINGKEAKLTLTVNVAESLPNVTLAKANVRLNSAINETAVITVPFKVPAGYEVTDAVIATSKGNTAKAEDILVTYNRETGELTAKVLNKEFKNGSYRYDITPIVKLEGEGYTTQTQLKKAVVLTVNVYNGVPNVTYTAKGKIDLVARDTGITYTLTKGTNFVYRAEDVDTETFVLTENADKFDITYLGTDAKGQHTVMVTAKPDAELKKGAKYSYNIAVDVEGIEEPVTMQKAVAVVANQSTVKYAVKGTTTIYQSYKGTNSLRIEATGPAGVKIKSVEIDAKATTVPKGVEVVINDTPNPDGSWNVSYRLTKASAVKVNRTYKLALKVMPEGGDETVKPTVVNVTLKVKR